MAVSAPAPSLTTLLQQATRSLRTTLRLTLQLSLFGIIAPYLCFEIYTAINADATVSLMRSIQEKVNSSGSAVSADVLFNLASEFSYTYVGAGSLIILIFIATFLAAAESIVAVRCGRAAPSIRTAWKRGFRRVPSGIGFLILTGLVMAVEFLILGPVRVLSALALAGIFISLVDSTGVFTSFGRALRMRFVNRKHHPSIGPPLMAILGVGLVWGGFDLLISWFCEWLLEADQWIGVGRSFWTQPISGLPFAPMYFLSSALYIISECALTMFILHMIGAFYFSFRNNEYGQTTDI